MRKEHGEAVEVMRAVKQALDPLGIMNPGKTLPPPVELAPGGPKAPKVYGNGLWRLLR